MKSLTRFSRTTRSPRTLIFPCLFAVAALGGSRQARQGERYRCACAFGPTTTASFFAIRAGSRSAASTSICRPSLHRTGGRGWSTSIRRSARRTGLGLAICRKIIDAHGGSISAENMPGHSSRFHIRLPPRTPGETRPAELTALSSASLLRVNGMH